MPPEGRSPLAPRGSGAPSQDRGSGAGAIVALGLGVALLGGVGWMVSRALEGEGLDESDLAPPALPGQLPPDSSAGAQLAAPPPVARCTPVATDATFVVGEAPTKRPEVASDSPPGIPGLDQPAQDDDPGISAFAVILGRGAATKDGFALGALRDGEGGSIASVITMDAEGRAGRVVRLARSRGDVEAPVVAAAPDGALLVALLEPNAGGRALRLARVVGTAVTWGAELSQGRDESLAIDLAVSGGRALAAWDEPGRDASRIAIASFGSADVAIVTSPRTVSPKGVDADTPRLVGRPGGFWLAYVARGGLAERPAPPREAVDRLEKDEIDEESGGERIETSWLEVVPLDELGAATGAAARVSPKEGTILGFDLAVGADGGAVLAWRDDASPTGGGGGTVRVVYVGPGGAGESRALVDEDVDDGVPDLLGFGAGGGWVAVSSLRGSQSLGRIDDRATVIGQVTSEPSLGRGEAVAALGHRILLATPEGRAVRFGVVECRDASTPRLPGPGEPPPDE